jgi:GNAT superfamily N-acetyltransferase
LACAAPHPSIERKFNISLRLLSAAPLVKRLSIMRFEVIPLPDEAQCEELEAFLIERIYEFNAKETGYFDGKLLAGEVRDEHGEVIAGYNGHTWGGCCELSHVWVHEQYRGQKLGEALLSSAEAEACERGCVQIVLATHSFQAPGFYERMGYERKYVLEGRPQRHSQLIYSKLLRGKNVR